MQNGKGDNSNRLLILAEQQPWIARVLTCVWGWLWRTIAWLKSYEHLIHYCNYETKKVLAESCAFHSQPRANRMQNELEWAKKEMVLREETQTNKCSANLLFHNIWSHILWWHRWVAGAPARRGGRCAAALSLWWPRWPGTELFREEHVNKCRANPLSMHRHKASRKWAAPAPPPTLAGPLYMMNIHMDASKCLHLMIKISITPPTAEGGIIPARRKPRFVACEWQFSSITPNISSGTSRHLLSLMTELFRKPLRGRGVYL